MMQTLIGDNKKIQNFLKNIYHHMYFNFDKLNLQIKFGNVVFFRMSEKTKQKARDQGYKSQYGQDYFLPKKQLVSPMNGTFIDVGCNKPETNSNTYFFEKFCGYSGLAIDALPDLEESWKKIRPHTNFLNMLVSAEEKLTRFLVVEGSQGWEHQLSGITEDIDLSGKNVYSHEIEIEAVPLNKIIATYLNEKPIDLLSIDVEGHELEVLDSIDWGKTNIKVIVMENNIRDSAADEKRRFLINKGYDFIARIWVTDDVFVKTAE